MHTAELRSFAFSTAEQSIRWLPSSFLEMAASSATTIAGARPGQQWTTAATQAKIQKYETFVDTRLKPDLVHAVSLRDKTFEQQRIFSDLAKNIQMLQENGLNKLKTMVNLGSEVYVRADVPDTSRILVDIGLGFHAEFTLDEALRYIDTKQVLLTKEVERHSQQIARIKAHIKLVIEGIRELMQIPEER